MIEVTIIALGVLLVVAVGGGIIHSIHPKPRRQRVLDPIPSHKNRDIIGDGAWNVPDKYASPPQSARIAHMPKVEV